jgi:type II secretion system protein N
MAAIKTSERTATILRRVLFYPSYFFFCSLLFAYCTFPYDRVRDRIEEEVERAVPGSDLEIVDLSPSWLSGVELEGVSLTLPGEGEERATTVMLTEVSARVGILDYLFFDTTSLSYSAELGSGGTIEGVYSDSESETHVEAHIEGVELGRIGPLRRYAPLPVAGTLSGDVDLTLAEEIAGTTGNVTLTIAGLAVGDGRARLSLGQAAGPFASGITIERIEAGDLNLRIQVERGVGRVQQLAASSADLELRGAGTVRLIRPIRMSSIDMMFRFEVKQPYRDRNDRTRAIFTMLDMVPDVRAYRAADGAFQVRVAGSFGSSLRASGAGSAAMPD